MSTPVSPPQPSIEPLAMWLEQQAKYHEDSPAGHDPVIVNHIKWLRANVVWISFHASLKARAEQAEQAVDVLESNAREQAKLLADTGRRVEELETALLAAREYVAGASLAAGTPAYIRCCELLIKIDGALAINSQGDTK